MSILYVVIIVLLALGILIIITRIFFRKKSLATEIENCANELKVIELLDDKQDKTIGDAENTSQDLPCASEPILAFEKKTANYSIRGIDEINISDETLRLLRQFGTYDHKLELAVYKYPSIDLLESFSTSTIPVDPSELEANKNKIIDTLNYANIEIDKIKATAGPTLTLYEITPAPGARVAKIKKSGK
jgi:DNA segregation ATPase FtsK/SpoIIIE-like protein